MGWPVRHLPDMRRHSMVHSRPSRFPGDAWSPSWTPIIRAALSLSPACLTLRVYSISECGNPWSGFPADCPGRSSKGGRTVPRRKEIGHRCHWNENWVRAHKAHRLTPAMAAGLISTPMEMIDLVAMIDAQNQLPTKRGPYRKRAA